MKKNKISQKSFTDRYLQNENYFSIGNKKFFNVYKTECFEIGASFGAIIEYAGEFLPNGQKHTSLKFVSHDKRIETVTGGFNNRNGKILFDNIMQFLKQNLGYYEKEVLKKLNSISISSDYKDTLLFESHNNTGFYLYFGSTNHDEIKIISHK